MKAEQRDGNYYFRVVGDMDWGLAQPMTSRCMFCGAEFTGTAGEAIKAEAKHRKREHPKAKDRGQRARVKAKKAANWSNFRRPEEVKEEYA